MNRIKELREHKGIGQKELAEKIGVTQQTISLYETGKREPKLETWQKLADYFNVSVPYLQGFININIPNNFKSNSKEYAVDCIKNSNFILKKIRLIALKKIMKALGISKEDLEKSINDEK